MLRCLEMMFIKWERHFTVTDNCVGTFFHSCWLLIAFKKFPHEQNLKLWNSKELWQTQDFCEYLFQVVCNEHSWRQDPTGARSCPARYVPEALMLFFFCLDTSYDFVLWNSAVKILFIILAVLCFTVLMFHNPLHWNCT